MSDTYTSDKAQGDNGGAEVATATDSEQESVVESGPEAATAPAGEVAGSTNDIAESDEDDVSDVDDSDEDDESDDDDSDEDDESDDDSDDADEESGTAGSGSTRSRGRSGSGRVSLRRLEEEGEVAADYLEELLDIADLDGDIDIDVENGRASVAIVADNGSGRELRRLVGARGEVLEALQELARLAVQAKTGERSRLMLDVAGFRAARRRTLEDVAARACQEVSRTGAAVRLDPMTAFERKIVHDVVADAGLVSESEGEEPNRRVVVQPVSA